MKVWVLEGCTNAYNCGFELMTIWAKKPSINQVAMAIYNTDLESLVDERIIGIVGVLRGEEVRMGSPTYDDFRLRQVDVHTNGKEQ